MNNEANEISSEDLMYMFKKIDGCTNVYMSDVSNWLEDDNDGDYASQTDEKIFLSSSSEETEIYYTDHIGTDVDNSTTIYHAKVSQHNSVNLWFIFSDKPVQHQMIFMY